MESVAGVKKEREARKKLEFKMINKVDHTPSDVIRWDKEGRKIFFEDSKSTFLKLDDSIISKLTSENRMRYRLAENIVTGKDVIKTVQDSKRGWAKDYNVRPGSSADNLQVFGKDKKYKYFWEIPQRVTSKQNHGWEIDHDPNVKTLYGLDGTLKTVGGENSPELILMRKPKELFDAERKKLKGRFGTMIEQTKEEFVKTANDNGVKAEILDD